MPKKQVSRHGTLYLHVRRAVEIVNFTHSKLLDLTIAISEKCTSTKYLVSVSVVNFYFCFNFKLFSLQGLSNELEWALDYMKE